MNVSGKLVIIGILAVALAGAGASWWFRYNATHEALRFWGAAAVQFIRDAPIVELYEDERLPTSAFTSRFADDCLETAGGRDISKAPGLVHLRNALLEDQSYNWPAEDMAPGRWGWVLVFRDTRTNEVAVVLISRECTYVAALDGEPGPILSCEPISLGLANFITEQFANAPSTAER